MQEIPHFMLQNKCAGSYMTHSVAAVQYVRYSTKPRMDCFFFFFSWMLDNRAALQTSTHCSQRAAVKFFSYVSSEILYRWHLHDKCCAAEGVLANTTVSRRLFFFFLFPLSPEKHGRCCWSVRPYRINYSSAMWSLLFSTASCWLIVHIRLD